jgi:Secretion system C-terminal sorting domain
MTFQQVEELEDGSIVTVGQQDLKPYMAGISKFDKNGNLIWHRAFDYNPNHSERFNSFAKTADKGFIVGGQAFQDIPSPKGSQGWLLKLYSLGCDHAGCAIPTSTGEVEDGKKVFVLSPNPADRLLTITFGTLISSDTKVNLIDLQGRIIQSEILKKGEISHPIDVSNISAGIYFIKISNPSESVTKKVIISH